MAASCWITGEYAMDADLSPRTAFAPSNGSGSFECDGVAPIGHTCDANLAAALRCDVRVVGGPRLVPSGRSQPACWANGAGPRPGYVADAVLLLRVAVPGRRIDRGACMAPRTGQQRGRPHRSDRRKGPLRRYPGRGGEHRAPCPAADLLEPGERVDGGAPA